MLCVNSTRTTPTPSKLQDISRCRLPSLHARDALTLRRPGRQRAVVAQFARGGVVNAGSAMDCGLYVLQRRRYLLLVNAVCRDRSR